MSKVISFRLNPENPREAEALTVLQRWLKDGFSTRYALTEALLKLDSTYSLSAERRALNDLSHQIKEILENIEKVSSPIIENGKATSKEILSEGFVTSKIKTVKPGMKFD